VKNIISLSKIILLVFIIGESPALHSQTISGNQISGTVTTEKKQPLEYVSVTLVNFGINTSTDEEGKYRFSNVPEGNYLLNFKLTGYESKTLQINVSKKNNDFDVILTETLIQTPVIDVTGTTNPTDVTNSVYSITSISGNEFAKQKSQNLAESIQNIPGVNNISTGTNIGKPVIRGLSSNSVLIIHDGVKLESQQWGDEHGPELSLFDLDRIEILRGPASLLYGSDGIGGVVNVISKPLEFSGKKNLIAYGEFSLGGYTVNNQGFGNLTIGLGSKNIGFKGHFGYRKAGNTKTPEGTFLVNIPNGGKETIQGGVLSNSGSKETEGGAAFGISGTYGSLNLGFETFQRELEMHDPDLMATASQKLNTNQFELDGIFNLPAKLKLEPVVSYQIQRRQEFETAEDKNDNISALNLLIKTLDAKLNLHHSAFKNVSGTVGVSFGSQENTTNGIEKLIPNYNAYSTGAFLVESYETKYFKVSVGGRYDYKKLNIKHTVFEEPDTANGIEGNILNDRSLDFGAITGSFGVVYKPNKNFDLFSNIGRGWRAPSEFELFVDGEHEGTGRYDRGLTVVDSSYTPKPEESVNIDVGLRVKFSSFKADLSFYRNRINNFIYPSPTGDTLNDLPVYNVKQDKSNFIGYEYTIQYQPVKWLLLSAEGDFVKSKNDATGNPLPFTPAMKNILSAKVQKNTLGMLYNPYFSFSAKMVSAQTEVDPLESKTDGYTLLNAGLGFEFEFAKSIAAVDVSVDNLLDTKYVDHLSRFKTFAMNPGRSFNIKLTVPFRFK
jgi:iron complex outermembrane receptor protein